MTKRNTSAREQSPSRTRNPSGEATFHTRNRHTTSTSGEATATPCTPFTKTLRRPQRARRRQQRPHHHSSRHSSAATRPTATRCNSAKRKCPVCPCSCPPGCHWKLESSCLSTLRSSSSIRCNSADLFISLASNDSECRWYTLSRCASSFSKCGPRSGMRSFHIRRRHGSTHDFFHFARTTGGLSMGEDIRRDVVRLHADEVRLRGDEVQTLRPKDLRWAAATMTIQPGPTPHHPTHPFLHPTLQQGVPPHTTHHRPPNHTRPNTTTPSLSLSLCLSVSLHLPLAPSLPLSLSLSLSLSFSLPRLPFSFSLSLSLSPLVSTSLASVSFSLSLSTPSSLYPCTSPCLSATTLV